MDHYGDAGMLRPRSFPQDKPGYLPREGSWEYDAVNHIDTWSETIFDLLEVTDEKRQEKKILLSFFREPFHGALEMALDEALHSGIPWDLEMELVTAKGKTIWVRSCGSAVIENDIIVKVRGTLMEIDKYRADQTSLHLLKQRHQQLSGFTHILTHNLRTYAHNIAMLTDMMERDKLDAFNAELLDKITTVSDSLVTTIEQIADILKINESVIESESLDFEEITGNVLAVMRAELEQHEAIIETDFIVPSVFFPKLYLDSILMNLISNSIKYRKEHEKPEVLISTYFDEEKNCVILEYQDNGIGIDLERYGDKIFGLYKTFTHRP
ncbi:MAG: hypothetical protein JWQ57_4821, partial [Mucilaginibacter sp.]|nr:hypothetical protein [Mucilaginibacter sp.]